MLRKILFVPFAAVLVLTCGGSAAAQALSLFADLHLRLRSGDRVTVTDVSGAVLTGRVADIRPDGLVLRRGSQQVDLTRDRIRQIEVCGDSVRNGTLIGLGVGAAYGVAFAIGFSDHPGVADEAQGALMFGGIGAGLGVGLDALIRRHVVVFRAGNVGLDVSAGRLRGRVGVIWRW